jgi:hypothetical protein
MESIRKEEQMEFEKMEKLAAFDHKVNTAIHKLRINIGIGLMDTSGEIERIKFQLQEIQTQRNESTTTRS